MVMLFIFLGNHHCLRLNPTHHHIHILTISHHQQHQYLLPQYQPQHQPKSQLPTSTPTEIAEEVKYHCRALSTPTNSLSTCTLSIISRPKVDIAHRSRLVITATSAFFLTRLHAAATSCKRKAQHCQSGTFFNYNTGGFRRERVGVSPNPCAHAS